MFGPVSVVVFLGALVCNAFAALPPRLRHAATESVTSKSMHSRDDISLVDVSKTRPSMIFRDMHRLYLEAELGRFSREEKHVESSRLQTPHVDAPMYPAMTEEEIAFFHQTLEGLAGEANYMEFGMGGSTAVALTHPNIHHMISVDSSTEWVDKLRARQDVSDAIKAGRLQIIHADIGQTGDWGNPVGQPDAAKWPQYSEEGMRRANLGDAGETAVLVDGRFRVASFLKALKASIDIPRDRTIFLIHDYDRDAYHIVEDFADVIERKNRLATFKRKESVDVSQLDRIIRQYELEKQ